MEVIFPNNGTIQTTKQAFVVNLPETGLRWISLWSAEMFLADDSGSSQTQCISKLNVCKKPELELIAEFFVSSVVGTDVAPCRIIVEFDNHVMSQSLNDVAVQAIAPCACPSHAVCTMLPRTI